MAAGPLAERLAALREAIGATVAAGAPRRTVACAAAAVAVALFGRAGPAAAPCVAAGDGEAANAKVPRKRRRRGRRGGRLGQGAGGGAAGEAAAEVSAMDVVVPGEAVLEAGGAAAALPQHGVAGAAGLPHPVFVAAAGGCFSSGGGGAEAAKPCGAGELASSARSAREGLGGGCLGVGGARGSAAAMPVVDKEELAMMHEFHMAGR